MNNYQDIIDQLKKTLGEQCHFYSDEISGMFILVLPFKDSIGDNFIIRLKEENDGYILDDGGLINNSAFIISETVGGKKADRLVSSLVKNFNARINQEEGVIELSSRIDEIISRLFHFGKLLVTIDTMLVEVTKEEKETNKTQRESLGPRASHKLRKPLNQLIRDGIVNHRYMVDGLTVPDWIVDFAYRPTITQLGDLPEMVVFITVDLAVLDPILKAAHAFSRAIDIKAAHKYYDIQVAFDTHGQNSSSTNAKRFLTEHQMDNRAYAALDLSDTEKFDSILRRVRQETGAVLSL